MFNFRQQVLLITGFVILLVFFLAMIGGQSAGAALLWGLVVGVVAFFLQRQNILVKTGNDAAKDLHKVTAEFAQSFSAAKVAEVLTAATPASEPTSPKPSPPKPSSPEPAPPKPASAPTEGKAGTPLRPASLDAPRTGGADDLKTITGIGPKLEETLNGMGYYHFDQIASWTPAEVEWIDENVPGLRGRAQRDDWVAQARDMSGN